METGVPENKYYYYSVSGFVPEVVGQLPGLFTWFP